MYVDVGAPPCRQPVSNSSTPCNIALCGTVLTVSNDGKLAVVRTRRTSYSRTGLHLQRSSASTAPWTSFSTTPFPWRVATAAASLRSAETFHPHKCGNMYVASASTRWLGSAFGIGGRRQLLGRWQLRLCAERPQARCPPIRLAPNPELPAWTSRNGRSVDSAVETLSVARNAGGSARLRMDHAERTRSRSAGSGSTGESTSIQTLTAEFTQDPIPYQNPLQFTCNPPNLKSFAAGGSHQPGQGAFTRSTRNYQRRQEMIVVSPNVSAVLIYNVAMEPHFIPSQDRRHAVRSRPPLHRRSQVSSQSAIKVRAESAPRLGAHRQHTNQFNLPYGDIQQVPYLNINDQNNDNMCNGLGTNAPLCLPNLVPSGTVIFESERVANFSLFGFVRRLSEWRQEMTHKREDPRNFYLN